MIYYYLYTHTSKDDNRVFYVGIGKTHKIGNYKRAYEKYRKNQPEWLAFIKKHEYVVNIIKVFSTKEECCDAEMKLIARYGRLCKGTGSLVNKAPGGHKWKDSMKIFQYSLDGKYLAEWISPTAAASVLNIQEASIYASCKKKILAGSFQFRTVKEQALPPYIKSTRKKVYEFDLRGNYLKEYSSITEAALMNKVSDKVIRRALKGVTNSATGKLFSFERNKCKVRRLIYQYDAKGKLLAKYSSLREVVEALKLKSHNSIDNALKGVIQKTAYGYTWKEIRNTIIDVD